MKRFLYGFILFSASIRNWHDLMFDLCIGEPFEDEHGYEFSVWYNHKYFFNELSGDFFIS